MPRRREVPKRVILPDPKYKDIDVSKFVNVVMLHGKKAVAEGIVYGAFNFIEKNAKNIGSSKMLKLYQFKRYPEIFGKAF